MGANCVKIDSEVESQTCNFAPSCLPKKCVCKITVEQHAEELTKRLEKLIQQHNLLLEVLQKRKKEEVSV